MEPRLLSRLQGRPVHPLQSSLHILVTSPQSAAHRLAVGPRCLHPKVHIPEDFRDLAPPTTATLKGTPFSLTARHPITSAPTVCFGELRGYPIHPLRDPLSSRSISTATCSTKPAFSLQLSAVHRCRIVEGVGVPVAPSLEAQ